MKKLITLTWRDEVPAGARPVFTPEGFRVACGQRYVVGATADEAEAISAKLAEADDCPPEADCPICGS